MKVPNF